ncbi:S-adenosyl-L-methionine-dependent methyltransferase [Lineolata rhizophorae]|uniref:S-adenosyl-L-methionine-dependent methyltransferase n=1 Tax=Lineolata rhizophorae TaxID=578093 RepID=A0A6A6NTT9_9PEZI|nr:S-adenosyl-L-methionine-dependent methyltransferase [Lineolata rhizophorae]
MTDSVPQEYKDTVDIHDRMFQKISVDRRIYCVPVDEEEEERLILQNQIMHYLFEEKLYFPDIPYPDKVLECGYGRASWAVQMAQTYEDCEITAIDIYPADLPDEPDNLECELWDLNEPLVPTYERNQFDLVHSHFVAPGIKKERWREYLKDLVRLTKKGGWVQVAEFYYTIQSDNGLLGEDDALYKWGVNYRAAVQHDRDPRVGNYIDQLLRDAGLLQVQIRHFRLPIGGWPEDPRQKWIGEQNLTNVNQMLDSLALYPFTQRLGWTPAQVKELTNQARAEAAETRRKLYIPLSVAWGRKRP